MLFVWTRTQLSRIEEEFLTLQKRVALLLKKTESSNDENYYTGSQKNIEPAFSASLDKKSRASSAIGGKKTDPLGASGFTLK